MPTDLTTLQAEVLAARSSGMDLTTLQAEALVARASGIDLTSMQVEVLVDNREYQISGQLLVPETDSLNENRISGQL